MVDYFESKSSKPNYVIDLSQEIEHIKTWYMNRFLEMDAYFGITEEDGIMTIDNSQLTIDNSQFTIDNSQFTVDNSQLGIKGPVYDLIGRCVDSPLLTPHSSLKKGLYIQDGKKRIIK